MASASTRAGAVPSSRNANNQRMISFFPTNHPAKGSRKGVRELRALASAHSVVIMVSIPVGLDWFGRSASAISQPTISMLIGTITASTAARQSGLLRYCGRVIAVRSTRLPAAATRSSQISGHGQDLPCGEIPLRSSFLFRRVGRGHPADGGLRADAAFAQRA